MLQSTNGINSVSVKYGICSKYHGSDIGKGMRNVRFLNKQVFQYTFNEDMKSGKPL